MDTYNPNRKAWRAVLTSGSGNLLEFYDFSIYAFFVSTIARLYFPNANHEVSLLQTFAAYGIGFVARPIGSIVIGRIGSIRGRKPAMLLTVSCMAIGSIGIALVPSYQTIGIAAPILLVALRVLQGFAAGGEYGTSVSYIVEWAPPGRRGFFGSFQSVTSSSSGLLASLVATLMLLLPAQAVEDWAWRIPFLAGGLAISIFSIFVRMKAEETPEFVQANKVAQTRKGWGAIRLGLKAFGFTIYWTVLSYVVNTYMFTYSQQEAGMTRDQALWISNIATIIQVLLLPVAGALSDRVGKKPLLLASCVSTAVLAYPILRVMSSGTSFGEVLLLQCGLGALFAVFSGVGPAAICEIFPTRLRTTWMAISYTLAVSIFGGFSPFFSTWLISVTHRPASPAFLLVPAALISALVICTFPSKQAQGVELHAG